MLIDDAIWRALASEKLVEARPIAPWDGSPRMFLMCQPLRNSIQAGKAQASRNDRKPWMQLEAAISSFVSGAFVTDDLIKQLRPPKFEHWELRSRKPRPSLRVFGRFAKPSVFVGTHVKLRKDLGGMWSKEFEHEKLVCEGHWTDAGLPAPFTAPPHFKYTDYLPFDAALKSRIKR